MNIEIVDEQEDLTLYHPQVEELVRTACHLIDLAGDELTVHFVTKEVITQLHGDHFDDPTPTDCITFPIDGSMSSTTNAAAAPASDTPLSTSSDSTAPHIIGEVFICPEVARETTPHAPYEELSLYIIHTLLHLAGYNDQTEEEIQEMRQGESTLLAYLQEKNLMLRTPCEPYN